MKKWLNEHWLLAVIVLIAFITRLYVANIQSFSNDELSALYRLQFSNFKEFMHWGVKVDGHPAFVQLFLYGYLKIVPNNECWVRLPFVLASTLSLFFIYFGIKKITGEFTASLVTIVMAFAGFSFQLGYFARPYAFGILFSSAAAYYWIAIFLEKKNGIKFLMGFIAFSLLAAYTHYFALLEIVVLGMATFVFAHWKYWWKIIVSGTIVFLGYLPHYPITAFQLSVGGIGGWLGKPTPFFILELIFTFFDSWWLTIAVSALLIGIMLMLFPHKTNVRYFILLVFLSFVPFLILYQYSIRVNSVLQLSACYFFMPFLLSALFHLAEPIEYKWSMKWLPVPLLITFLASAFVLHPVHQPIHFAEFKRIAAYIEECENDSVTTIVAVNNPAYIDFYLKDKKPDLYISDMGDNLSFLSRYIDTCKSNSIIYAFANQRSNIEIPVIIYRKFNKLIAHNEYVNSELFQFAMASPMQLTHSWPGLKYKWMYSTHSKSFVKLYSSEEEPYSSYSLDTVKEFGPTFQIKLSDLPIQSYNRIISSATVGYYEPCDIQMVLSIEQDGKTVFWRSRGLFQQYGFHDKKWENLTVAINPHYSPENYLCIAENLLAREIDLEQAELKIYLWNPNHCDCKVSDHAIWIVEGNKLDGKYSQ